MSSRMQSVGSACHHMASLRRIPWYPGQGVVAAVRLLRVVAASPTIAPKAAIGIAPAVVELLVMYSLETSANLTPEEWSGRAALHAEGLEALCLLALHSPEAVVAAGAVSIAERIIMCAASSLVARGPDMSWNRRWLWDMAIVLLGVLPSGRRMRSRWSVRQVTVSDLVRSGPLGSTRCLPADVAYI